MQYFRTGSRLEHELEITWQDFLTDRKKIMRTQKKSAGALIGLLAAIFFLSGCYETHYYHRYNHHTRTWYDRHHTPPPSGINFEIDVETRHHRH